MRSILRLTVAAAAFGALTVGAAAHKPVPQQFRQSLMHQVGGAMKTLGGMAKGEIAYDAGAATKAFATMHAAGVLFGDAFPAGTETGDETEAGPAIWSDAAGFEAANAKFVSAAAAAVAAAPADADAFKPVFGSVAQNCKSCHEDYRVKKN